MWCAGRINHSLKTTHSPSARKYCTPSVRLLSLNENVHAIPFKDLYDLFMILSFSLLLRSERKREKSKISSNITIECCMMLKLNPLEGRCICSIIVAQHCSTLLTVSVCVSGGVCTVHICRKLKFYYQTFKIIL